MALLTRSGRKKVLSRLSEKSQAHLQQLILSINMLADISFADVLVLLDNGSSFYVLGHARPINSSTVHLEDMVGAEIDTQQRPFISKAFETCQICEGGIFLSRENHWIQTLAVPINLQDSIIGVMICEKRPLTFRDDTDQMTGQLEASYFSVFRRLAQMVTDGTYPFNEDIPEHDHPPRVGDGLIVLDSQNNAEYISPNAHSALGRIGIIQNPTDKNIRNLQLPALTNAHKTRLPQTDEIEANDYTIVLRCLPLLSGEELTGTLILLRDITELRRRDRLLLTKDATIAEIHHRVKNNLQTISSLLQLQTRRLSIPEARFAISESARRIRSIAIVHEILAHKAADKIKYEEILKSLLAEIQEALISPEIPIELEIKGSAGAIPSDMASTLTLIMSELIQNAIDHAFSEGSEKNPKIVISFNRDSPNRNNPELKICISDNGVGIPADFSIDDNPGLGLTIVRTLMEADLRGNISIGSPKKGAAINLCFQPG